MIRGMYASAAGMMTGVAKQELLASNLANANTVGYRRTRCATQSFSQALDTMSRASDLLRGGSGPVSAALDTSEGAARPTGSKFDLAINGPGYFAVQTPQGMRLTRDGRFHPNEAGRLVDGQGNPVVGVNGYIDISGDDFEVSETGQIKSGGKFVGDLLIADVPAGSLTAASDGLYATSAIPARATGARIMQGSLEESNVVAVREMGSMMQNQRYYEANAAALRQQDQTTQQLLAVVRD